MARNSTSTEVETASQNGGEVQEMRPAQRFRAYALDRASHESNTSGEDVSASQIDKVFQAETAEDIFKAVSGGTVQARDVVGLEIEILSMRLQESDRFEGSSYYANLDVTIMGGPREVLTRSGPVGANIVLQTGAEIIIAQVRAFEARGLLPQRAVIVGTQTNSGYEVLKLGEPPQRTVTATTA